MAHYIVNFEGKLYASEDLYCRTKHTSPDKVVEAGTFIRIGHTRLFGPLSEDEHGQMALITHEYNDVDEQLARMKDPLIDTPCISAEPYDLKRYEYRSRLLKRSFLLIPTSDLRNSGKYYLKQKMAILRVAGKKNQYIVADKIDPNIENPLAIMLG